MSQEEMAAMYLAAKQGSHQQQARTNLEQPKAAAAAAPSMADQQAQWQAQQQAFWQAQQQAMAQYQAQQGWDPSSQSQSWDPSSMGQGMQGRYTGGQYGQWYQGQQQGGGSQQNYYGSEYAQMYANMTPEAWQQYMSAVGAQAAGAGGGDDMHATIRQFLEDLKTAVTEGNVATLDEMYSRDYAKLSDQIAKLKLGMSNKWPDVKAAEVFLGTGEESANLLLLYKELYYRHLYSKVPNQLTASERVSGWEVYTQLFALISGGAEKQPLPLCWLWDMLDEFLYQYQQYQLWKAKTVTSVNIKKTAADTITKQQKQQMQHAEKDWEVIQANPQVFDKTTVEQMLAQLVAIGATPSVIERRKGGSSEEVSQVGYMGYFAQVQLMRNSIVLGDFDAALATAQTLDFGCRDALYYKSPSCHCSFFYHLGCCMLMKGRYSDATSIFGELLNFEKKVERFPPLHALYSTSENKRLQEKMSTLLGVCHVLAPDYYYTRVDEHVMHGAVERTAKLRETNFGSGFLAEVMSLFHKSAPSFISQVSLEQLAAFADSETKLDPAFAVENTKIQAAKFQADVEAQKVVPFLQSYLKMFTNLHVAKLAEMTKNGSEAELLAQLDQVQKRSYQTVLERGDGVSGAKLLPGRSQLCTDIGCSIEGTNIVVTSKKQDVNVEDYFVKSIKELQTIQKKLAEQFE